MTYNKNTYMIGTLCNIILQFIDFVSTFWENQNL